MTVDREELRKTFEDHVKSGFKGLQLVNSTSNTANFYKGIFKDGSKYLVKVFNGKPFFRKELYALDSLRETGRVCEVLFDSTQLEDYYNQDFSGPYFIVKPFFEKLFTTEKSPIRLLERCAQQVDISLKLWTQGWMDFDGRFDNDAITLQGRVVRFDLDSAICFDFLYSKYGVLYHTVQQTETLKEIRNKIEQDVLNEKYGLTTLCTRFSYLFFSTIINQEWTFSQDIKREEWLGSWMNLGKENSEQASWNNLTKPEARAIGSLFYNILNRKNHGFQFKDLYSSLMLLCISFLAWRYRFAHNQGQSLENLEELVKDLVDLHSFLPLSAVHRRKPSVEKSQQFYQVQCRYRGGAWPANKGTDRICEDMVQGREIFPYCFLLADGASLASGYQAIQIVESTYLSWIQRFQPQSVQHTMKELDQFIQEVHKKLLDVKREKGTPCETTLVIGVVVEVSGSVPVLLLMRYGDSNFLVVQEKQNNGQVSSKIFYRSRPYDHPPPLGNSASGIDLGSLEQTVRWEIPLREPAIYRVRAFSDGVAGGEEKGEELVLNSRDIQDLVECAANWPNQNPGVGGDDWSIAGLDITVNYTKSVSETKASSNEPGKDLQDSISPFLDRVDSHKFHFSEPARQFWEEMLTQDTNLRPLQQYPLIKDLFINHLKVHSESSTIRDVAKSIWHEVTSTLENKKVRVVLSVFGVIVLGFFFYFVRTWVFSKESAKPQTPSHKLQSLPQTEPPTSYGPAPGGKPTPPAFSTLRQQEIYSILQAHREYTLYDLPKGSGIDKEPLATFLRDMQEVLKKTSWNVEIEVHTDLYSSLSYLDLEQRNSQNKQVSERRAQAIEQKLKSGLGSSTNRIKAIGMGDYYPVVAEWGEADRAKNRRLVVYR